MKKIKITQEQYNKMIKNLSESKNVKGGINRVDKTFKKNFSNLDENMSSIVKQPNPSVPHSKMQTKKEIPMPKHPQLNEDIFSPELHQAIKHFLENIWLNPSQKGLDKFFIRNGITWGDIISYLTSIGVIAALGAGVFKIKNVFKKIFSSNPEKAKIEKAEEIDNIAKKLAQDPQAPWSKNKLKDPKGGQIMTKEEDKPWNIVEPPKTEKKNQFEIVGMGHEIAILKGPDGLYSYFFDDIRNKLGEDPAQNSAIIAKAASEEKSVGEGLEDFYNKNLVKVDETLKKELLGLYSEDKNIVDSLNQLDEITGAASSGAFTGNASFGTLNKKEENSPKPQINKIINNEDEIYGKKKLDEETVEEMTTSASSGQYVQPAIWAKNEKSWKGKQKTQYPNGEFVSFDPCVKYNNNKEAQKGGCSQGAVDNVVKLKRTKNSVISKNVNESIQDIEAESELVKQVRNFIENNNVLNGLTNSIRLQDSGNEVILKYEYWERLPEIALKALEEKYNVEKDIESHGSEKLPTVSYILTPKDVFAEVAKRTGRTIEEVKKLIESKRNKKSL
jgi:hypothetical protein